MFFLRIIFLILSFILVACSSRVEIPEGKAALVISDDNTVSDSVLVSGAHTISFGSSLILFNTNKERIDFDFEFISNDAISGYLKFSLEFEPVIDSLAKFYKEYETPYFRPAVETEVRSWIRNSLDNLNKEELNETKVKAEIFEALSQKNKMMRYVRVVSIGDVELEF